MQKEDSLSNMKIARETIFVMISILVFCNKKIFESCKSFLFLLEERKNGVLGILSGRVFEIYVLGSGIISIFSFCFLFVVNSKFTLEMLAERNQEKKLVRF